MYGNICSGSIDLTPPDWFTRERDTEELEYAAGLSQAFRSVESFTQSLMMGLAQYAQKRKADNANDKWQRELRGVLSN